MLTRSTVSHNHHLKYIIKSIKTPISLVKALKMKTTLVTLNALKYSKAFYPKIDYKIIPVRMMPSMGYYRYLLLNFLRDNNLMMIIKTTIKVGLIILISQIIV